MGNNYYLLTANTEMDGGFGFVIFKMVTAGRLQWCVMLIVMLCIIDFC